MVDAAATIAYTCHKLSEAKTFVSLYQKRCTVHMVMLAAAAAIVRDDGRAEKGRSVNYINRNP